LNRAKDAKVWDKMVLADGQYSTAKFTGTKHELAWSGSSGTPNYTKQHHLYTGVCLVFLGMAAG
jgi:hypothetical protein